MAKEKVLITVKTYPTISSKYKETVCTARLRQDGSWVRIYPVPFRQLQDDEKYKKFDWIQVDLERNHQDERAESYRPISEIERISHVSTRQDWRERRELILNNSKVFHDFAALIEQNKNTGLSLATFKPAKIIDLLVDEDVRDWDPIKVQAVKYLANQGDLFKETSKCFNVVRKLPYKFRYHFADINGHERKIMISDWEIGMLYWNELKRHEGDEQTAIASVKKKYLEQLVDNRDIHFFMGTTQQWDARNAPNPFMIIGVFSPPKILQTALF